MVTRRTRTPVKAVAKRPDPLRIEYRDITDIEPYEYNARDNAEAIKAVKKSIETFGFANPILLDQHNVVIAGHTRLEAAKELSMTAVPIIRLSHLTPTQVKQLRLVDNKVAEIAEWDPGLLAREVSELIGLDVDMTGYGWTQPDLDCLNEMVRVDCLDPETLTTQEQRTAARRAERRAPTQVRLTVGEFVFFLPQAEYRPWADGLRALCHYNDEEIAAEIKRRLFQLPE